MASNPSGAKAGAALRDSTSGMEAGQMVEIIYLYGISRESLGRSSDMISGCDFLFFCGKQLPEQISVRLPGTVMLASLTVLLKECIINAIKISRRKKNITTGILKYMYYYITIQASWKCSIFVSF